MINKDCCICNKPVAENNFLLDGRRYHDKCINELRSSNTKWDELLKAIQNNFFNKRHEIKSILNSRSFFQKLFNQIPESINQIENDIEQINLERNAINKQVSAILEERRKNLFRLYDYWPSRPPDWDARSYRLRKMVGYCRNCGTRKTYNNPLQVHHIIPISKGGNHKSQNLEVLCLRCHREMHNFDIESESLIERESKVSKKYSRVQLNLSLINKSLNSNLYLSFKHHLIERNYDQHIVKVKEVYHEGVPRIRAHCYLSNFERVFRVDKLRKLEVLSELPANKSPGDYIEEAMDKDLMIHCSYTKRTGGKSIRTLKPVEFTSYKGVKVLNCFDYLTEEYRCFSPQRMNDIEIVSKPKKQKIISGTP